MNYQIISEEGCTKTVELIIPREDFEKEYNSALKSVQAYAQIPGFRKGKVPTHILKKKYGESLEIEAIEKLANEEFKKYVEETKTKLADQPNLIDINNADEIKARIKFEAFPEFELMEYKGLKINEPVHFVTDDEIEHAILHIQLDNAKLEPANTITDEFFTVDLEVFEIGDDGNVIPNPAAPIDRVFLHDHNVDPKIKELVLNKEIGDEFDYTNSESGKNFRLKILKIEKHILPELTPDFIKSQTEDRLETIEDFKEDISLSLNEKWAQNSIENMEHQVQNLIVDMHDFPVPNSLVEYVAKNMFEDYQKRMKQYYGNNIKLSYDNMKASIYPDATKIVKWELIRDRIIEKENLQIEDYDIEDNFAQYMQNMDIAQIKEVIEKNPNLKMQLLTKKVFDLLISFAETTETDFNGKPINFEPESTETEAPNAIDELNSENNLEDNQDTESNLEDNK